MFLIDEKLSPRVSLFHVIKIFSTLIANDMATFLISFEVGFLSDEKLSLLCSGVPPPHGLR